MPTQKANREGGILGRPSLILDHQGPFLLLRIFGSSLQQYCHITGKFPGLRRILSFQAISVGSHAEGLIVSYARYAFWD
jgi:hypothetical protein